MYDKKNYYNSRNAFKAEQTLSPSFSITIGAEGRYSSASPNIITYTLEEHLKQFRDDENYKVLYNCWQVEKKIFENRLKNINIRYQTYRSHDSSHSEAILRQIEFFLGEERIHQLTRYGDNGNGSF